jgi:sugar/nucleoside kinase (ribokinase family)
MWKKVWPEVVFSSEVRVVFTKTIERNLKITQSYWFLRFAMKRFWAAFFVASALQLSAEERFISPKETKYDVLIVGAAIADYFAFISDTDLTDLKLEKGGWALVSDKEWSTLKLSSDNALRLGGSAMNVIKSLSSLGVKCACLGKIGTDDTASGFSQKLHELHIHSLLQKTDLPTGKALCYVTPDGQKTMRTCLGASSCLSDLKLNPADFEGIRLFHMEGYQIVEKDLMKQAFDLAAKEGALISMDLGNFKLVEKHRDDFFSFIKEYVDIVFANEEEAKALTGMEPMFACRYLGSLCDTAIVTMGDKGGWVKKGKEQYYFPALPIEVKDTTGAGDYFASGFLLGVLQGKTVDLCAWLGSYMASQVVREIGTDIPLKTWREINEKVQNACFMVKKDGLPSNEKSSQEIAKTPPDTLEETSSCQIRG